MLRCTQRYGFAAITSSLTIRFIPQLNPKGSFFTSARLIYVAAKEGYLPSMFGRLHKTRKTPLNAMLLQAGVTMLFIVFGGGFRRLINFAVVASWA